MERLRDLYAAAGYGHGHRVSILLENRPEFFFHYLALNALGVCIVPINPDYRHDEIAYLLDHSEVELAVVLPHRVADVAKAAAERAKPLPVVNAHAMPAELPRAVRPGPALRCSRSAIANARCSTRPAPRGGRRAACCRTSIR